MKWHDLQREFILLFVNYKLNLYVLKSTVSTYQMNARIIYIPRQTCIFYTMDIELYNHTCCFGSGHTWHINSWIKPNDETWDSHDCEDRMLVFWVITPRALGGRYQHFSPEAQGTIFLQNLNIFLEVHVTLLPTRPTLTELNDSHISF